MPALAETLFYNPEHKAFTDEPSAHTKREIELRGSVSYMVLKDNFTKESLDHSYWNTECTPRDSDPEKYFEIRRPKETRVTVTKQDDTGSGDSDSTSDPAVGPPLMHVPSEAYDNIPGKLGLHLLDPRSNPSSGVQANTSYQDSGNSYGGKMNTLHEATCMDERRPFHSPGFGCFDQNGLRPQPSPTFFESPQQPHPSSSAASASYPQHHHLAFEASHTNKINLSPSQPQPSLPCPHFREPLSERADAFLPVVRPRAVPRAVPNWLPYLDEFIRNNPNFEAVPIPISSKTWILSNNEKEISGVAWEDKNRPEIMDFALGAVSSNAKQPKTRYAQSSGFSIPNPTEPNGTCYVPHHPAQSLSHPLEADGSTTVEHLPNKSKRTHDAIGRQEAAIPGLRLNGSCDSCLKAKVKCGKGQPVCARCLGNGNECKYSPSAQPGRKHRRDDTSSSNPGPQKKSRLPTGSSAQRSFSLLTPPPEESSAQDAQPASGAEFSDQPSVPLLENRAGLDVSKFRNSDKILFDLERLFAAHLPELHSAERPAKYNDTWHRSVAPFGSVDAILSYPETFQASILRAPLDTRRISDLESQSYKILFAYGSLMISCLSQEIFKNLGSPFASPLSFQTMCKAKLLGYKRHRVSNDDEPIILKTKTRMRDEVVGMAVFGLKEEHFKALDHFLDEGFKKDDVVVQIGYQIGYIGKKAVTYSLPELAKWNADTHKRFPIDTVQPWTVESYWKNAKLCKSYQALQKLESERDSMKTANVASENEKSAARVNQREISDGSARASNITDMVVWLNSLPSPESEGASPSSLSPTFIRPDTSKSEETCLVPDKCEGPNPANAAMNSAPSPMELVVASNGAPSPPQINIDFNDHSTLECRPFLRSRAPSPEQRDIAPNNDESPDARGSAANCAPSPNELDGAPDRVSSPQTIDAVQDSASRPQEVGAEPVSVMSFADVTEVDDLLELDLGMDLDAVFDDMSADVTHADAGMNS